MASAEPTKPELQADALKLRVIRHKYASTIALQARIIALAAKRILSIEAKMQKEAVAVTRENCAAYHTFTFDSNGGSMQTQFENLGEIDGPGFLDIKNYADRVFDEASAVATAKDAPPLPYEED